ncbi:hypothetical protein ABDD95_07785 [Mucilaginibacter sp. PAMB04274]|uniref:hypothetical protein n=1 Tax=Mucilaginibacter sp. PAMB04274 TaxID=3138568 RepID=UPI0031F6D586
MESNKKNINLEYIQNFIKGREIPLVATQTKLSVQIIFRLCQKMAHDIKFDEIKVSGHLVIDGHHRYLSALIMAVELGQLATHATSATQEVGWDTVLFDEEDWDTPAKIAHLNEMDAKYNNLEVDFVKGITTR